MKKLLSVLIGCLMLSALGFGAFTASGTGGVVTKIGATHSWYLANNLYPIGPNPSRTYKAYFDIVYTVGDETSVAFNIGFLYSDATPAVANISYFPERNSAGEFSVLIGTLLKATGNQRYTVSFEVPDRAYYTVITFAATGGTPTGTIVFDGYMKQQD
jgi:hypothetical protein